MKQKIEIDHIGFRAAGEDDYLSIRHALENVSLVGVESRAEGHTRTFFDLGDIRLEVQLWDPDLPQRRKQVVHVDVRAENPMAVLANIGPQAEDWGDGETPRGGILVTSDFMVMARPIIS